MASKYQTTRASGDNYHANFRFGAPSSTTSSNAVPANYQLTLTPYSYIYLNVQYGSTTPSTIRVTDTNINTPITVPFYGNAADIVNVFNASAIRDFGDLSKAYPKTVSVGNASRMKKLTLGNSTTGYDNTVFTTLTTDANPLLEELDVTNISSLTQTLDLHKLVNLKKLKAFGTNTPNVLFADNGKLDYIELPAVNGLGFKNLRYLDSKNIKVESYNNVVSLIVENCPLINKAALIDSCNNLQRIRVTDVNLGTRTYEYFENKLFKLKGIAANGEDILDNAYITGECYIEELTGEQYANIVEKYPNLTIKFGTLTSEVVFMDTDGETELKRITVVATNSTPTTCPDPNLEQNPIKVETAKYKYKFEGWTRVNGITDLNDPEKANTKQDDALLNILTNRILYPAFTSILRSYDVVFYNPDITSGSNQYLATVNTYYGYTADYSGSTPTKLGVTNSDNYMFVGWEPSIDNITGPLNTYAQFQLKESA
jgi:hypothetical protein